MTFFDLHDFSWLPIADAVVKATMLLATAALCSALLTRRSAATRHFVWTLALLAILALPVLSIALPRWQLPLLRVASGPSVTSPDTRPSAPPLRVSAPTRATSSTPDARPAGTHVPTPESRGWPSAVGAISWPALLLGLWVVGLAAVLGRLAVGFLAVRCLAHRTRSGEEAPWFEHACALANDLGVSSVRFLRGSSATMPMACGVLRPAIVMPGDADTWPSERLRIVLLHELAHVKRRDCLTHALAQFACALYWFNPLVWIAARHVRMERERACDDLVLASGTRGSDYADQLLEIARVMRAGRFRAVLAGASLAMAYRSQLEGRLMAILDPKVPRAGLSRVGAAAATALTGMLVLPLASVQPWAYGHEDRRVDGFSIVKEEPPTAQERAPAPAPTPAPVPAVAPLAHVQERQARQPNAVEPVIQGTAQAVVQDVVQSVTQGIAQGVMQSVTSSVIESAFAVLPGEFDIRQDDKKEAGSSRSKADPRTVAALTSALKDTDADVREAALQALVRLRDPGIYDVLVEALRDTSAEVRQQAAFGLGQLRDKRAASALTSALKDTAADVRQQAVFALGQLRDPASVDALMAAVRDTDADVRQQAVFALAQLRDRRAVEPLISSLKDANPDVRQQAAFGLGQLRDTAAVEPLVIALKDSHADVRQQAAFALGQLDDARAIDALTAALKDASADVRQQAAFALGQLAR